MCVCLRVFEPPTAGRYSLSPDDYILGALTIYMDIINLFMFILTIIGFSR